MRLYFKQGVIKKRLSTLDNAERSRLLLYPLQKSVVKQRTSKQDVTCKNHI